MTDTAVKKSAESVKMPENGKKKHLSWQVIACVCLVAVSVVLNVVAWKSTAFCDWYTAHVFPLWENTYGRLTSLLPFSFGELLIAVAVFGIPLSLVAMLVLVIVRKGKRKKTAKIFGLVYMWIVTFVVTVQTFNCFVIYHCSSFAELNGIPSEQHTRTELEALGNKLVTEINALSKEVERDGEGKFVLTADLDKTAQEAMRGLSADTDNDENIALFLDPCGSSLDPCKFFLIIILRECYPAEKIISQTVSVHQSIMSGSYLRSHTLIFMFTYKTLKILCVKL